MRNERKREKKREKKKASKKQQRTERQKERTKKGKKDQQNTQILQCKTLTKTDADKIYAQIKDLAQIKKTVKQACSHLYFIKI